MSALDGAAHDRSKTATSWGPSLEAFQHVYRLDALRRLEKLTRTESFAYVDALSAFVVATHVDVGTLQRHERAKAHEFAMLAAWADEVDADSQTPFWRSVVDGMVCYQGAIQYLGAVGRERACHNERVLALRLESREMRAVIRGVVVPRFAEPFFAFGAIEEIDDPAGCRVLRGLGSQKCYLVSSYAAAATALSGVVYKTPSASGFIALHPEELEAHVDRGTVLVPLDLAAPGRPREAPSAAPRTANSERRATA